MPTLLDVQLARLLYPLVIDIAHSKTTRTYSELIDVACGAYPNDQHVANLIPVRMGRILWVIYNFVEERNLPRLTLVIVSKTDKYPGSAMWQHDCEEEQRKCFDYDWSLVKREFDLYSEETEKIVTPLRRVRREDATRLMADYYRENRSRFPERIRELREAIIGNIINGVGVAEAFSVEAELLAA